ncbi:MAG: prepilin-type N-terminal cleavage/methylation domain-containing protein [candidate division Zixibacteria bacterium]|nr:prepilin-type N-terminal cleavage/methylation domain-containing protein [candidate division Zixibacteria bacterium]
MSAPKNSLLNYRGFSLIEVLIALVLTGIITTAILKLYVTQHENYLVQDDITTIQQNARASIDELTRQIRMAGHEVPLGMPAIEAANTNPDTITITYHGNGCDAPIDHKMPTPSAELRLGEDVGCFDDGQWAYIFDPDSGYGEWFEITHVQTGANHIQHNTMDLSRCYDTNAVLIALNRVKFFIDNTTDPDHPSLMMQRMGETPQVYATDIVGLEFRYGLSNGDIVDQPVLIEDIREVKIEVIGRSAVADPDNEENPYRRRVYHSSVNMRNVGL